jgi:hypothetical protein
MFHVLPLRLCCALFSLFFLLVLTLTCFDRIRSFLPNYRNEVKGVEAETSNDVITYQNGTSRFPACM